MENNYREDLLKPILPRNDHNYKDQEERERLDRRIWTESKKMWVVAGPSIFTRFSMFGVSVITQAFIGHLGSAELAAYALVFTVIVRFSNSILFGMSSALETLCGQAYGAKQHHMLGIYLQRSWIVNFVCMIIMLPLFIFTTPILLFLGQEQSIAKMAGTIALWFIPINFSSIFSFTFQMYLQSQSKNLVITYLAALTLTIHVFLSWLFVVNWSMGLTGAMSSMLVAMWIPTIGQFGFVMCGGCPDTWKGFSFDAFRDLWLVIKISLSSGAMICLELWYFPILILISGYMMNAEVAIDALAICLNISGWTKMIAVGFMGAAGVRVANELGVGNARKAKFSVYIVVGTSFLVGVVVFAIFLAFRGSFAYLFTNSEVVANAVAGLSSLLAITILLSSVQMVLSGVAVGAGRQGIVAYVNLGSYYLIGIPLGILLGYFSSYEVEGIWMGMLIGTGIQTIVLAYITWKTDWNKQVVLAKARVNRWVLPPKDSDNGRDELQI